jgi:hypothetical protein
MTHWLLTADPNITACGLISAKALPVASPRDPNILKIDCENCAAQLQYQSLTA